MSVRPRTLSSLTEPALAVGATLALCTAVLLRLYWPVNDWLSLPLAYQGDGLWNLFVIKTVLQTGWYASNPQLGAPFGADFLDFAKPELLHLAFFRLAGGFTQNIALVHNLFYALGFHLVALSALAVLRRGFGLSWPLAVAGALLFAFLPFHFFRLGHLFLSSYYVVPIAAWLVLKVAGERPPFFEAGRPGAGHWTVWAACAVLASTSIYYAFFGLCLIVATGALEALRRRVWQPLGSAALVCALLAGLVMANLAPSLWHRHTQGRNPEVAVRSMQEVEVYALRPLQMVLPSYQHRSPTLAAWTRAYEAGVPFVNENRTVALGLLGSAGLLLMLLALLAGHRVMQNLPAFGTAARASAVALGLGMAGGGGSLLALALSPQFRALNRISVVIAFFAIAALLLLIQHALRKAPGRLHQGGWAVLVALLLLVVGLWDQIPTGVRPASDAIGAQYASDRAFVQRIERQLPAGSRILQLPYIAFPEAPPLHTEGLYSPLRGFLHGERLRWSYGGMNARVGDLWHRALAEKPMPERVRIAAASGFNGIWLDRRATPDGGARLDAELRASGLIPGFQSADQSLAFYPLRATGSQPVALPLPPLLAQGFYPWEHDEHNRWAWTRGNAQLVLSLPAPPQAVRVALGLKTLVPRGVQVVIQGRTVASAQLRPGAPQELVFEHVFSDAQTPVQLRTDVPAQPPRGADPRPLAMALMSVQMTDLKRSTSP